MDAKQEIITRLLPKTNQSTVYRTGDDGTFQKGWWKGRTLAGNKTRFIANTIAGDAVVIDRATGLMWPANANAEGCNNGDKSDWAELIDYAINLSFAGFSDWRIPNVLELVSIVNYATENPSLYTDFFPSIAGLNYWSATTRMGVDIYAWCVSFSTGSIVQVNKDSDSYIRCVRSL